MRVRGVIVLFLVLAAALLTTQCSRNPIDSNPTAVPSSEVLLKGKPTVEKAGNCLSFPVIWSDGVTRPLRGTFGVTRFDGVSTDRDNPETAEIDIMPWYHQGEAENEWRADSRDQLPLGPLVITQIDWGDNLEAKAWYESSVVRVETVIYQNLAAGDEMTGYRMLKLNDASGLSEVWGTNTSTYQSSTATVYSGCARLTIQKLSKLRDDPELNLTWNPAVGQWEGDISANVFNGGVWEASDGPGYYSAEINVQGKVIYGFNWYVTDIDNAPGDYRLTFSLDDSEASPDLNTYITSGTTIYLPVEEIEAVVSEEGGSGNGEPDQGGGVAKISPENNLTYIDVRILSKTGGGTGGK